MLYELRVENLLLIERAELRLGPGLNVLTGETGAGKTVLASALDLLLGGRAKPAVVRPGAAEAYVEGAVELDDALRAELGDLIAPDADELLLARRVSAEGRSRALINGRTVTAAELREVASGLISFYGQHEHRRLMLGSAQLATLDAACGDGHEALLEQMREAFAALRDCEARLADLRELCGARERELDLLAFEIDEIDSVAPSEAEEAQLAAGRERLRHHVALSGAAQGAAAALDTEDQGALHALSSAASAIGAVAEHDGALAEVAARLDGLLIEAGDLASELRMYSESLDAEPGVLEATEERLAAFERLRRKHGGTIESVLAHAERCRSRHAELESAEFEQEAAEQEHAAALAQVNEMAGVLRAARREAAGRLAADVRERLDELSMPGAGFEVAFTEVEPGAKGTDGVEFMIAPNPGVAPSPLRDTASGGELSRVMLALLGAANAEARGVLVFDEIDAGIGGHTARAVGEQVRGLAEGRQVVCITHLPQVAAFADTHFSISKDNTLDQALTTVTRLDGDDVIDELVRMLGAAEDDTGARKHARELRKLGALTPAHSVLG